MKQKIYLICLFAIMQSTFFGVSAKDVYGFLTGSSSGSGLGTGLYKFDTEDQDKLSIVSSQFFSFWGGAYADGKYYCILSQDPSGLMFIGLSVIDLDTGILSQPSTEYNDFGCTDLTYDYSTSTMYGVMISIGGSPTEPTLIKINLETGTKENVAVLSDRITALACTYAGEMYGIGSQSDLYKINKIDGTLSLIGNTGISTKSQQIQSLEFDHTDGQLYWSGLDNNQTSFLIKLNARTAEVESRRTMYRNALFGGLYIPFKLAEDGAPASVVGLTAQTIDSSVTLSWTNPSKTFKGEALNELTSVEIYRDGEKVHTVTNPNVGVKMEWKDLEIEKSGFVKYEVYAYNSVGKGVGAIVSTYVGKDIPSAVSDLEITLSDKSPVLSWKAPLNGKNGGELDAEELKYAVIRMPDNKRFTNITQTTFTDNQIEIVNNYYYQVTCYNEMGESDAISSDTVMVGNSLEVPYYPDFTLDFDIAQWKVFNENNDNRTWIWNGSEFAYTYSWTLDADDWLISVPIKLLKGMDYRVKYDVYALSVGSSENFRITIGTDCTPVAQVNDLEVLESFSNKEFETHAVPFTVKEDGDYCLGLQVFSKKDQFGIKFKNIQVEPYGDNDLSVLSFEGEENLTLGKEYTYKVSVFNNGRASQGNYKVQLVDQNQNVLASKEITEAIAPNASQTIDLTWIPESVVATKIYAKVVCENDINKVNDQSKAINLSIKLTGEDYIELGGKDSKPNILPYGFKGSFYSMSEVIYFKEEINLEAGLIKEVVYTYINDSKQELTDKHVKIFMKNTLQESVAEGWIQEDDMVLVYDSNLTFKRGENRLNIELDTPYYYMGGNLCILNQKVQDASVADVNFYAKNYPNIPRTAVINNDNGTINVSEIQFSSMVNYVQLLMKTNEGGVLSGKVTYDGKPLSNVNIEVEGCGISSVTNKNGEYKFAYLLRGDYMLNIHPMTIGVDDATVKVTIVEGETLDKDIELAAKPAYKLSGKITGLNDASVRNALVLVNGYNKYQVSTNEVGYFELNVYQADNYQLEVLSAGYKPYSSVFNIESQDLALSTIKLDLVNDSPSNVIAKEAHSEVTIDWNASHYATECKYDNGNAVTKIEISNVTGNVLFGAVHPVPSVVYSMSWFINSSTVYDYESVRLFIFALDEKGLPTNEILFSKEDVYNVTDKWNLYELSEAVKAPYGYMVAIGSTEYVGLTVDDGSDFHADFQYVLDYMTGEYYTLESQGIRSNFLLRANAMIYNPTVELPELPSVTYNVYRMKTSDKENRNLWTLLNAQSLTAISYVDKDWNKLEDGSYLYAVEATFINGKVSEVSFSNPVLKNSSGIDTKEIDWVNVYPNPAQDYLYIDTDQEVNNVSLVDITGKEVYNENAVNKVDLSHFNGGLYLLKVKIGDKFYVRKVEVRR